MGSWCEITHMAVPTTRATRSEAEYVRDAGNTGDIPLIVLVFCDRNHRNENRGEVLMADGRVLSNPGE